MNALQTENTELMAAEFGQAKYYVMQLQNSIMADNVGRLNRLVDPGVVMETGYEIPVEHLADDPPLGLFKTVTYIEDIPVIDGVPVWEKFDSENLEQYELFKRYREMRRLNKAQRSIYKLSIETQQAVKYLETLRQVFHWHIRAQAYDLYQAQERQLMVELRQEEIEGRHSQVASDLFNIASTYLVEHKEALNPKIAIQMLEMAAKLERLAAGLGDGRRSTHGTDGPTINISNNLNDNGAKETTIVSGQLDKDKERLTQVLNIMNSIGALQDPAEEIEVEGTILE